MPIKSYHRSTPELAAVTSISRLNIEEETWHPLSNQLTLCRTNININTHTHTHTNTHTHTHTHTHTYKHVNFVNHSNCWHLWFVVHLLKMRALKWEAALKEELGRCSMKRKSLSIQLKILWTRWKSVSSVFSPDRAVADWLVGWNNDRLMTGARYSSVGTRSLVSCYSHSSQVDRMC